MNTAIASSRVMRAEQGERLRLEGSILRVRAKGDDTGGTFCLLEIETLSGKGMPSHVHAEEDVAIYVIEGEIEVKTAGNTHLLGAGSCLFLPRNTEYGYRVTGEPLARLLLTVSPAGLECYFAEMARLCSLGKVDPLAIHSLSAEYGIRFTETACCAPLGNINGPFLHE